MKDHAGAIFGTIASWSAVWLAELTAHQIQIEFWLRVLMYGSATVVSLLTARKILSKKE